MEKAMIKSQASFEQMVAEAYKQCRSALHLSRSPLATGDMIAAGLVLDELSPTPDERGLALRLVLQWAAEQLAPEPSPFPFGADRPLDDPTWRNPHWWRYTILRHRYLEPLHPDDFVEGGRLTETLLALTGIPSADMLYDERTRALREAAQWLKRQQSEGIANDRLQALALSAVLEPLRDQRAAIELLSIASVFDGVFARDALLALAEGEGVTNITAALDLLVSRRCLQEGDDHTSLWMAPALRDYVLARQPRERLQRRHLLAGGWEQRAGHAIEAALHFIAGGEAHRAPALLLALGDEERLEEAATLTPALRALVAPQYSRSLGGGEARALHLLLADLLVGNSQSDEAIAVCREALRHSPTAVEQGIVYRRLAKLYEEQNQQQALSYYQMALERLPADHPETHILLKDRAWIYIQRRDWDAAEADLTRALDWLNAAEVQVASGDAGAVAGVPSVDATSSEASRAKAATVRADIYDGLSNLRRGQGDNLRALADAHAALALREQAGDLLRVGKSFNNLGILYRVMGEYDNAIAAYREAQEIFQWLDNSLLAATALLNIGTAHHFAEQLEQAEHYYLRCLALTDEVGLPLTKVRAHANLVEALFEQGRDEEAVEHWQAGYRLSSESGFDDDLAYLRELVARYPALNGRAEMQEEGGRASDGGRVLGETGKPGAAVTGSETLQEAATADEWRAGRGAAGALEGPAVDADEAVALAVAKRSGRVNAATFMTSAHVSKATATRKLSRLAEAGLLVRHGQGRGTYYTPAPAAGSRAATPVDPAALQARLDALTPRYSTSHGVDRFEVRRLFASTAGEPGGTREAAGVAQAGPTVVRFDVRAVFRRMPELQAFFELEEALSDATRTRINLLI
jgi:tetratricopeptide (TPR) repeat protein